MTDVCNHNQISNERDSRSMLGAKGQIRRGQNLVPPTRAECQSPLYTCICLQVTVKALTKTALTGSRVGLVTCCAGLKDGPGGERALQFSHQSLYPRQWVSGQSA